MHWSCFSIFLWLRFLAAKRINAAPMRLHLCDAFVKISARKATLWRIYGNACRTTPIGVEIVIFLFLWVFQTSLFERRRHLLFITKELTPLFVFSSQIWRCYHTSLLQRNIYTVTVFSVKFTLFIIRVVKFSIVIQVYTADFASSPRNRRFNVKRSLEWKEKPDRRNTRPLLAQTDRMLTSRVVNM